MGDKDNLSASLVAETAQDRKERLEHAVQEHAQAKESREFAKHLSGLDAGKFALHLSGLDAEKANRAATKIQSILRKREKLKQAERKQAEREKLKKAEREKLTKKQAQ